MTKEQGKQINGGATAVLAVGVVVGVLLSAILGIVLVLIAGGLYTYVFVQQRKASS